MVADEAGAVHGIDTLGNPELFEQELREAGFRGGSSARYQIFEGAPTILLGEQEFVINPDDCYGFKAGSGVAHQLVNCSEDPAVYLEVGHIDHNVSH